MSTLYRKYRPQNFTEIVGQNHIKITLVQEIRTGRAAHAYLFCGPRAVGKTTMARVLAKSMNCEKRKSDSSDPCNQCLNCDEITEGRSLDIIEIDAASNTGVDNVRDNIIASARTAPSRLKYKIFIIDEAHMLSVQAFNALLKIMEEPPANVIFILCTTEAHKIPITVISRCQRFDFKRIGVSEVAKKLAFIAQAEKIKISQDILESVARHADGHMRDAESLLGQIIAIGGAEITREEADLVIPRSDLNEVVNLLELLIKKDAAGGVRLVNRLVDDGVDLKIFAGDMIEILRKIMIAKISPGLAGKLSLELGETFEMKINGIIKDFSPEQALKFLERFIKVSVDLKSEFIRQLPFEMAIAEICSSPAETRNPAFGSKFNVPKIKQQDVKSELADLPDSVIIEKWSEVLAKVKQYNHSLSFILRVCQPRGLSGNRLALAFKYKFHKDRVSETNIKNIIENVLRQVYGTHLIIQPEVDENIDVAVGNLVSDEPVDFKKSADEQGESGNMIDNLLKTFGGKIVS